ncbi:hypothetical protein [Lacticaseibacillus absianus]|nr:hypothetical protein [Lacticaseibacillus absianus]
MTAYEQAKQFYAWGIDIKPFVGLTISQAEYEEITKAAEQDAYFDGEK